MDGLGQGLVYGSGVLVLGGTLVVFVVQYLRMYGRGHRRRDDDDPHRRGRRHHRP